MEVVLLPSAERDLQEAYNWIEEHRGGREQFFLQDVELRLEHLKKFPLIGRRYRGRYRRYSSQDTLLVSSTLSSQTGLLSMRSPISGKIPKRSESAFPNRGYFTVICLMEAIFVLNQIVD
jgi:plasmid stabilization system protein ParE